MSVVCLLSSHANCYILSVYLYASLVCLCLFACRVFMGHAAWNKMDDDDDDEFSIVWNEGKWHNYEIVSFVVSYKGLGELDKSVDMLGWMRPWKQWNRTLYSIHLGPKSSIAFNTPKPLQPSVHVTLLSVDAHTYTQPADPVSVIHPSINQLFIPGRIHRITSTNVTNFIYTWSVFADPHSPSPLQCSSLISLLWESADK